MPRTVETPSESIYRPPSFHNSGVLAGGLLWFVTCSNAYAKESKSASRFPYPKRTNNNAPCFPKKLDAIRRDSMKIGAHFLCEDFPTYIKAIEAIEQNGYVGAWLVGGLRG